MQTQNLELLFTPLANKHTCLCTSHLKLPHPPIWALVEDYGDFHLIYASFWFPGRRGIRLKSRSSHPRMPYRVIFWSLKDQSLYFIAANRVLTSVLCLAIISCFTKEYHVLKSRGWGMHHSLLSPGTISLA